MASPNTGIFAGEFIKGFLDQRQSQKDQVGKDKIIKLQTQLIEQQLATGKIKLDAQTKVSDLFTGTLGEFEQVGETAPAPSGSPLGEDGRQPVPQFESSGKEPMGLLDMLSDPESFAALIQSEQVDIGDFIGKPQQATSRQRDIAFAHDPSVPQDQRDTMLQALDSGADDDVLAQIVLGQQEEKLNEQRRERGLIERTEGEEKIGRRQAVRNDFGNAKRIIEIQQKLEGTALATGIPYGDFIRDIGAGAAALVSQLGFDVSKASELIALRDELVKLFADGTLEAIDRFKGTGTITNQKFEALIAASPEVGKTAVANAKVLAGRMRAVLDAAERKGEIIPNRKEIEDWIEEMKSGPVTKAAGAAQAGAETVSDFASRQFDAAKGAAGDAATFASEQFNKAKGAAGDEIERRKPQAQLLAKKLALEAQPFLEKARSGVATAVEIAKLTLQDIQQLTAEDIADWTKEQRAALDKRLTELGL